MAMARFADRNRLKMAGCGIIDPDRGRFLTPAEKIGGAPSRHMAIRP